MHDPLLASVARSLGITSLPLSAETPRTRQYRMAWEELASARDGPINPQRFNVTDRRKMAEQVKAHARSLGADLVGICALQPSFIDQGKELSHHFVIALVVHEEYAKALEPASSVHEEAFRAYAKVAEVTSALAKHIRNLGYPALAHHNRASELQVIPILYQAGIGELGRNGSLINEQYGGGFRAGMVTTDLPLEVDEPREFGVQDFCLHCHVCMNNCPGGAIPEDHIITDGVRRWITNVEKCYPYSRLRSEYCHLCVDVCPFNSKREQQTYVQFMKKRVAVGFKTPRQ